MFPHKAIIRVDIIECAFSVLLRLFLLVQQIWYKKKSGAQLRC